MATKARIDKRRLEKRKGHTVKCWKSKWETCICSANRGKSKRTF